jgi:hypothetical protein
MPGNLDHSKSILPYKDILESYEESYRDATVDERPDVIEQISNEIKEAAGDKGAKIPDEGALHKVYCGVALRHHL